MSDAAIAAIVIAGVIAGFFKLINNQNKLHNNLQPYIVTYMWKRTA